MKLSIFGLSLVAGGYWGVAAFWCVLMELVGVGSVPYEFVDQLCLGMLSPSFYGAMLGATFGFLMGVGFGIIGGLAYNRIADFSQSV